MTARRFLGSLVVLAGLFLLFNLLVHQLSRGSLPRNLLRAIRSAPDTELAAIGKSLVEAGFNPGEFSRGWSQDGSNIRAFNAGLGSTGPVEHYLVGRQILRYQPHSQRIVYGYFDFQLTDDGRGPLSEVFANRSISLIYEPDVAAGYLFTNGWSERFFPWLARLPVFVERGSIWAKVERQRRWFGDLGLPRSDSNHFGRAEDFRYLETSTPEDFQEKCRGAQAQRRPITPAVDALFREADGHGVRIYVVEMPMTRRHRDRTYDSDAWRNYNDYLLPLLAQYHAVVISAGDWVPDELFADPLHLGPAGAVEFSHRLGSAIRTLENQRSPGPAEKAR